MATRADGDHGRLGPGLAHLQHRRLVDAAEAYGAIAPVVPLRGFSPLVAERDYHHEIGLLQVNRLRLMSWAHAPVQFNFEPTACVPLEACFSGCRFARTRGGSSPVARAPACCCPPGRQTSGVGRARS